MLLLNEDAKHAEAAASAMGPRWEGASNEKRCTLSLSPGSGQLNRGTGSLEEASYYSQEEIKKMPRLKDGHFRTTPDGYHQVRYRRDGYDVQFTSKDLNIVKKKFLEWCRSVNEATRATNRKMGTFFTVAEDFFATVKKTNVSGDVYHDLWRCMELHVLPRIGAMPMRKIAPSDCQSILNALLEKGKSRTAETVEDLLNEVFNFAIGERALTQSPMKFVKIPPHDRERGVSLSLKEVQEFLSAIEGSVYRKHFLIFLYTGIRRNELRDAVFADGFLSVLCGKRKTGQRKIRRSIPVSPAIAEIFPLSEKEKGVHNDTLTQNFKKLCPGHSLKDLRHTFTTQCQQCGIPKELVDVWTAHVHKQDMTVSVYTHFSREFQLEQILKLHF